MVSLVIWYAQVGSASWRERHRVNPPAIVAMQRAKRRKQQKSLPPEAVIATGRRKMIIKISVHSHTKALEKMPHVPILKVDSEIGD